MRDVVMAITLDPDETLFSMDVKSLYTNVPVMEAIDLACDALYNTSAPPGLTKSTFKRLMELAVTNVWFLCDSEWYIQKDGVAMGASLAVILANIWMKKFEPSIATEHPTRPVPVTSESTAPNEAPYPCGKCKENVTRRGYSIKCNTCLMWYHRKCTDLSVPEMKRRKSDSSVWYCGCNSAQPDLPPVNESKAKVFGRYVDDILRSAKINEIEQILTNSNSLHKNLEFTIEKLDNNRMPFLDMMVHLEDGKIQTSWYQKPTDTGLVLHYRALAPTTYKRNITEGTIHRILNATTSWMSFDDGLQKAIKIWENNQYPPQFYQPIIRKTMDKIINGKSKPINDIRNINEKKEKRSIITLQYRGTKSDKFAKKLKHISNTTVIFTTRKMKTALPSLKSPIPKLLLSHVVYQITCPGCQSSYVGQTTRHLTTRIQEHSRISSHVGDHLKNCNTTMEDCEIKVIDRTTNAAKLLTLEALHISRRAPSLNQKEEYRARELTLRI